MYHKFVFFDVFSHSNGDNVETIGNFVETKFKHIQRRKLKMIIEELTTENMIEILNSLNMEGVVCYENSSKKCRIISTKEAHQRKKMGEVLIMPYEESLRDEKAEITAYADKHGIVFPDRNYWQYLREEGLVHDFFDFRDELRLEKLKEWLKAYDIKEFEIC